MYVLPKQARRYDPSRLCCRAAAIIVGLGAALANVPLHAGALERIKDTGHIKLGYLADARPFSFKNEKGAPDGYTVRLCERIAASIAEQLALPGLTADWIAVDADDRVHAIRKGEIDLLCTPTNVTPERREDVSFSIPVFASGNRAAVRADAPATLRDVLSRSSGKASWRGSPLETALGRARVGVVGDTPEQQWLGARRTELNLETQIVELSSYRKGMERLLAGKLDVMFGDRALMVSALAEMDANARRQVLILDRPFTDETAALPLQRGDDDFQRRVDRALSEVYSSAEFPPIYATWIGELDDQTRAFFTSNAIAR